MTRREEPIKVSLVTDRWAPSFAGAAQRFRQYLPGLREQGVEVEVLCSTAPSEGAPDRYSRWERLAFGEILEEDELDGTRVHRVKLPAGHSLRRNLLFREAVSRVLGSGGAEVAQFLTMEPLRTYRDSGLRRHGVRGVFTGTQLWRFSRYPLKRTLQQRWIRHPIQKLDHVVVSSTVMRDFYESLGVSIPMSVVPNGVDLERYRTNDPQRERQSARESLGIPAAADLVVFIGSIIHRKGVDLLIDAFKRVAMTNLQAELVLVGPRQHARSEGVGGFGARIDSLVSRSGVADRIHFTGHVAEVDGYLRAADVFVLPSRREGMGNVVLEAMALGIPTLLTPYLGLPSEFGEPGKQYVLSAPDADSLASHIESLLADWTWRWSIGTAGQRWVADHMSMSSAIEAYAEIYHDLAGRRVAGPQCQEAPWNA